MADPLPVTDIEKVPLSAAATVMDFFFRTLMLIVAPDIGLFSPLVTLPVRVLVWESRLSVKRRRISSVNTDFLMSIMASFI
jgi:hypothetical protein